MNYSLLNLISAIVISVLIIFGWQYFYERPNLDKLVQQNKIYNAQVSKTKNQTIKEQPTNLDRSEAINASKRIKIESGALSGSISLKGLRFDDLTLLRYRQTVDKNSKPVELLSPSSSETSYFAEIGWWGETSKDLTIPDSNTVWQADQDKLLPGKTINFQWTSPENVKFLVSIYVDDNYMFTIKQAIFNNSNQPISIQYYGIINRNYVEHDDRMVNILHQGMIGAVNGELEEYSYNALKEKIKASFTKSKIDWFGITDKYWLTAFIPDQKLQYSANYIYALKNGQDKFQADFISSPELIEKGGSSEFTHRFFAGPKKVNLLDKYEKEFNIKLFDRAIDFGWFYILTKPIFHAMNFFYDYVGNFGISIMIVTVLIKLLMFTLANKSYRSMKKMKKLQPEMERLKELYSEDKARLNQEIMALYKREKVNPISGCLPLLIQIPVFFSIYKVLYVTIEMRHTPFFGWIQDLSAADPTSIFNLFGLLPFIPPSFLMIGAWPIIMAISMYLQQKMTPQPADPVQAQVMKFMPIMFLFMFGSFPAGLLIYWSWNNVLSIIQQYYINKLEK